MPEMIARAKQASNGLVVLNAGSSSIKFSLFSGQCRETPSGIVHGEIEGIVTAPHFSASDSKGQQLAEHRWDKGATQEDMRDPSLPQEGIWRFGFHGLSYEYVATIIGFSALDGLPMGTRCGVLDPGVVLYRLQEKGMDAEALEPVLYHQSGLLGVSGLSSDVRRLLASSEPRAREAINLLVYRATREMGSLAAAARGLDALVFTAGIGEHSAGFALQCCSRTANQHAR